MANLNDLAHRFGKELPARIVSEASRCSVEVATLVHNNLSAVTPVDTSRALSNWDVWINNIEALSHIPYVPGKWGSTEKESERAANIQSDEKLKDKRPGDKILIANQLTYISGLNDGKSAQEPAGFVERSVSMGKLSIRKFKMRLG